MEFSVFFWVCDTDLGTGFRQKRAHMLFWRFRMLLEIVPQPVGPLVPQPLQERDYWPPLEPW